MRKVRPLSLIGLGVVVWIILFTGCSGSNSTTVTLAPASGQTLSPGQTVTITATVANDKSNQGVTWSLSGPGSLSNKTTSSVVYTAPLPNAVTATTTATITATSIASTTATATESITVNSVLTITTASLTAGTIGVPYDVFVSATGAPAPFTWAVISGSLPPGLTFMTTPAGISAEITGTPAALGTSAFTVQVTDTAGNSVTQPLSITINPPPPLSVGTLALPNGTVGIGYTAALQAKSGVPPYTWSVPPGTLPTGLGLASNGVISGTPTATGTFPFTVQVVDSSTPPQMATANLSITIGSGVTDDLRLNGNYAFSVRGFDPNGLFVAAGSFTADGGGHISGGLLDTNNTVGVTTGLSFTGTYGIDPTGLGTLTINLTGGGSRTFALSMLANGNANIIEFDDSTGSGTRNSGVVLKQDITAFSTASITGNYAFGFLGIDSGQNRFGMVGDLHADGSGILSSGVLDSDDAISGPFSSVGFTGTYSVATNGRGVATITTLQGTTNYVFYVVDKTQLLTIETDAFGGAGVPLVSGSILQQSGPFNNGSLNAASVFEVSGLASGPIAESQVGLFTGDGSGNLILTSDQNAGGTPASLCSGVAGTCPPGPGTYNVAANGRVTLTDSGFQNSQPVMYLLSGNRAFIIGTDAAVSFGFMTPQFGVSTTSLSGTYAGGSIAPAEPNVSNVVSIAVAGSNNLNVTSDISSTSGLSTTQVSGATSVAADGRVVVTGVLTEILYMVSPEQFFSLASDSTARVDIFQQ